VDLNLYMDQRVYYVLPEAMDSGMDLEEERDFG
jgi:hypothetical protein